MPARASFKISIIHRELSDKNEIFEESKKAIILKYAKKDKKGEYETTDSGSIRIEKEHLDQVNEELNKLSMTEFTVGRVSVDELGDISFSPKLFSLLSEIIIL